MRPPTPLPSADFTTPVRDTDIGLAALDLIRAYAHDGLHFASYRLYQLHPDGSGPVRVRYGINFRRPDGRTYSQPDLADHKTTRNLGIIMEGATDREARAITRNTAQACGIVQPAHDPDRAEYLDVTGNLPAHDLAASPSPTRTKSTPDLASFLARMTCYERTVGARYATFLTEISAAASDNLHAAILAAIITGSLADLCHQLNQSHGPATFTRIFTASSYGPSNP